MPPLFLPIALSLHMHSLAPSDYSAVTFSDLRFRGGAIQDTEVHFAVTITGDDDKEPEESFFITYNPQTNALVIPPTTEVRICRGK